MMKVAVKRYAPGIAPDNLHVASLASECGAAHLSDSEKVKLPARRNSRPDGEKAAGCRSVSRKRLGGSPG